MAPDRKNMGITMKFIIVLKLSRFSKKAAMIMPNEEMQKESRKATHKVKD
jgi:hypothetical protein